jgi:hypothetical protein
MITGEHQVGGLHHGVEGRRGATFAPTELVEAGVGGDAVQPGAERSVTIEASEAPHGSKERILGGIGRVLFVVQDPAAHSVDTVVVPAEEHLECSTVAALSRSDE